MESNTFFIREQKTAMGGYKFTSSDNHSKAEVIMTFYEKPQDLANQEDKVRFVKNNENYVTTYKCYLNYLHAGKSQGIVRKMMCNVFYHALEKFQWLKKEDGVLLFACGEIERPGAQWDSYAELIKMYQRMGFVIALKEINADVQNCTTLMTQTVAGLLTWCKEKYPGL